MAFLDPVFNPVLQPLLDFDSFLAILLLSLVISLLITLVYKYLTNQAEMKRLKEQQKEFQNRMKGLRSNPEEMMKIQKEAMKVNMEYMKHSLKPTLVTMLPIILIFGWMNAHLAYEPIQPGSNYDITLLLEEGFTGDVELQPDAGTEIISQPQQVNTERMWRLKSSAGEHFLIFKTGKETQTKKVLITKTSDYAEPITIYENSAIKQIKINYNKLRPLNELARMELSLFGWQPGWLGIYIILSIIFSLGLRKALKLY